MTKYTHEGINKSTFELLFSKPSSKDNITIKMILSRGLYEVDIFTYYRHNIITNFVHSFILNPILFPHIHPKGFKRYLYKSQDEDFEFILLNKYFKKIFKDDKDIGKILLDNYKYGYRSSTCQLSIVLTCTIENSRLVMGNFPIKDGSNVLHRIVEIDKDGTTYVLDVAKNIILKKDDYYKYSHFEPLSSISCEDLRILYTFCLKNNFCNHTKIISMFGEEILRDLDKNDIIKKKEYTLPNLYPLVD